MAVAATAAVVAPGGGGSAEPAERSITVNPGGVVEHGQELEVSGEGFAHDVVVGVALCTDDAVGTGDLNACDAATVTNTQTDGDGAFSVTTTAKAIISTTNRGSVDCTAADAGCVVAAAEVADLRGAEAVALSVDAGTVPLPPTLEVTVDGLDESPPTVTVAGRGHTPGQALYVVVCATGDAGQPILDACDQEQAQLVHTSSEGTIEATLVVRSVTAGGEIVDCPATPDRCVVATPLPPAPDLPASVPLG